MPKLLIIVYSLCIIFNLISIVVVEDCTSEACNKQADELRQSIQTGGNACENFYDVVCGKLSEDNITVPVTHQVVSNRIKSSLLKAEVKKVDLTVYKALGSAIVKYRACQANEEPEVCFQNLTLSEALSIYHLYINQTISEEAHKMAQAIAINLMDELRKAKMKDYFKFNSFLPKSDFLRKRVARMRIEVGYPQHFNLLEHIVYLDHATSGEVDANIRYGENLRPAPFWPVDMIMGEPTYHRDSNTIYIPLEYLLDDFYFRADGPEVYNYARLGLLIAKVLMREYISALEKAKIFSLINPDISTTLRCIRDELKNVKHYKTGTSYEESVIRNEVVAEIAHDMMALRIIFKIFTEAAYRRKYLFPSLDTKFNTYESQFFVIYAKGYCDLHGDKKIKARLTAGPGISQDLRKQALGYYRVILPLRNMDEFSAAFGCAAPELMSVKKCL